MKKSQIILIVIGVLILTLIGLTSYFIYFQKIIKPGTVVLNEGATDLCAKFSKVSNEITCQEARDIALKNYPGDILNVEKTTTTYQYGKPPEIKTEEKDVWIIKIKLKEPALPKPVENGPQYSTGEVGVVVDRNSGEILSLQTFPEK